MKDMILRGYIKAEGYSRRMLDVMRRKDGQTTVEWTVIIGAIVAILVAVIPTLRKAVVDAFTAIAKNITDLTK